MLVRDGFLRHRAPPARLKAGPCEPWSRAARAVSERESRSGAV